MNHRREIRRAVESELAEVVQLEREIAAAPHWALAAYERMLWTADPAGPRRVLYIAVDGRVLSGFVVGSILGAEAEIESVVVRESARRQGLGSSLCRAVLEWARAEGAHSVHLEVRSGSAGARRLYGGLGFVAVGRRANYYKEPVEDGILMRCEVQAPADEGPGLFEV